MTKDKALKRDVRARMAKTGESYTAARHFLTDQHLDASALVVPEAFEKEPDDGASRALASEINPLPARVAEPEMSDEAVLRATGRGWDDWFRLLDDWGATNRTHAEIARMLGETYPIGGWWAQSVTVGYERARGMRAVHERPDGFSASISRTVNVPVERLARAFFDEEERARWLESGSMRERSRTPGKVWRFEVAQEGSRGEARLAAKGDTKSSVAIQHERLRDAEDVARWKAFWSARLGALLTHLTTDVG